METEVKEVSIGTVDMKQFKEARDKGEMTVTRPVEGEKEADADAPEGESHDADKPRTRKEQRRWDNLVKQREEARAEAKAEKTAKEELRQREADAIKRAEEAEARANTKSEPEDKSDPRPELKDFDSMEDHQEAMIEWKDRKTKAAEEKAGFEAKMEAEKNRIAKGYLERATKFAADHPDFEAQSKVIVKALASLDGTHFPDALMDEDNSPQIVEYLAKHLDVCAKMSEKGWRWAIAEVGRISERLAIQAAKENKEPGDEEEKVEKEEEVEEKEEVEAKAEEKPKIVSKAPTPFKPVGGSNTKSSVPLGETDMKTYKARRAAGQIR